MLTGMPIFNSGLMWFPLALAAALAFAGHNGVGKKALESAGVLDFAVPAHLFFALINTLVLGGYILFWENHKIAVLPGFFPAALITSALNVAAILLLFSGIKASALSTSIPFLSLTPVFTVLTGWILIGERISPMAVSGIVIIAFGSYFIHAEAGSGLTEPYRKILTSTGSRNLLIVALLFSISSVVDKIALLRSSLPVFLIVVSWIRVVMLIACMAAFRFIGGKSGILPVRSALITGLLFAVEGVVHMGAIASGPVSYVISIKRCSVFFSSLLGFYAFREQKRKSLIAGVIMMVTGAVILALNPMR